MPLRATILGCGTSSGVPRIGGDWGSCDPTEKRNRRTRASILIESDTTRILVDTSPDLREQMLSVGSCQIDAVVWTHDHADHCHGIDDLRQIFHSRRKPLPGYARIQTLRLLNQRFNYIFEGRPGYPKVVDAYELESQITIGDINVRTVDQPHGDIFSTGFLFESDAKSIGYSTDFHEINNHMRNLFRGAHIWIVDALRERPHPTHAHLDLALASIKELGVGHAYLTHMDQSMDYLTLSRETPENVLPAYDGLVVEVP